MVKFSLALTVAAYALGSGDVASVEGLKLNMWGPGSRAIDRRAKRVQRARKGGKGPKVRKESTYRSLDDCSDDDADIHSDAVEEEEEEQDTSANGEVDPDVLSLIRKIHGARIENAALERQVQSTGALMQSLSNLLPSEEPSQSSAPAPPSPLPSYSRPSTDLDSLRAHSTDELLAMLARERHERDNYSRQVLANNAIIFELQKQQAELVKQLQELKQRMLDDQKAAAGLR